LLAGTPDLTEDLNDEQPTTRSSGELEARVSKLEQELAALKEAFDDLMKQLS
jgi:uncharacterized protein YceH (UPF0502 family)